MDIPWILVIVAIAAIVSVVWKRRIEQARTPEDAIEAAALRAERYQARTKAIEASDRFNTRP